MKVLFQITALLLFFTACKKDNDTPAPNPTNDIPTIKMSAEYDVLFEEDVEYAQGLSHQTVNSNNSTPIPLLLDVYAPDNDLENRPAFLFIHGGGFNGGIKHKPEIVEVANYYTSRGWVFFSIDYRVVPDLGTVPPEWLDHAMANTPTDDIPQFLAMYFALRDAKAAMRWLVANAETYNINTDYITVGGASAGAITSIALGISNQEDYRDEISPTQDPTLASTNLDQTFEVQTIVDFWGSTVALDAMEAVYGHQRYDENDPPMIIVHGTEDPAVPFAGAEALKSIYEANNVPMAFYPIDGAGHGIWEVTVDGKRIEELAFDFIVEQQGLVVE